VNYCLLMLFVRGTSWLISILRRLVVGCCFDSRLQYSGLLPAHCGHQVLVTMPDPAPVVGLSPRDPLNGFTGSFAC